MSPCRRRRKWSSKTCRDDRGRLSLIFHGLTWRTKCEVGQLWCRRDGTQGPTSFDNAEVRHKSRVVMSIKFLLGTEIPHISYEKSYRVILVESGEEGRRGIGRVYRFHTNDLLFGSGINDQSRANLNLPW